MFQWIRRLLGLEPGQGLAQPPTTTLAASPSASAPPAALNALVQPAAAPNAPVQPAAAPNAPVQPAAGPNAPAAPQPEAPSAHPTTDPAQPEPAAEAEPATAATRATAATSETAATPPDEADVPALPMAGFNAQTESLHWIYGLPRGGGPGPNGLTLGHLADLVERMSLDVSRAADWVPRVPAVLPSLLRSLRDDNHSAHDLAALLEQDVTLLAEALKAANSAQHAHDSPITDTADAVRLLGSHGLRLVIARVAFRPVLGADAGALTQAGAGRVWALADACAQASRDLAPARGVDPFEAFLSGLAAHVGLLVSLRMADRAAHLARPDPHGLGPRRVLLDDPTAAANQHQTAQDLMHLVALLSHRVAARWELPDNVVGTLTGLCDPLARARWSSACELLEVAQETARLLVLADADWLPAPRPDCWSHLPADAQDWLARQRSTPSHSSTSEPA